MKGTAWAGRVRGAGRAKVMQGGHGLSVETGREGAGDAGEVMA